MPFARAAFCALARIPHKLFDLAGRGEIAAVEQTLFSLEEFKLMFRRVGANGAGVPRDSSIGDGRSTAFQSAQSFGNRMRLTMSEPETAKSSTSG